ncbi:transglycosylase domain-containing protein [Cytobacillus dafuensis]|uniref:PBP1A family penicillin-binding protein n=1 Tax=Cytobacillus dafuensis TaxID=1742359 RepID=A0A5B8Z616_CYTDA|nr:PBP1A family penicillin-binding protein [Cytobacillus dafuensis]QED48401.1 PBP1A family penicillin-binding protein [Cytobacillus dafuensis]
MSEKYQSREERRKQQTPNPNKKKKKQAKGIFKRIFLTLIALGIAGMLLGAGAFAYMVKDAPKLDEKQLRDPIPSKILDKDGNVITEVGSENREYVEYEDIPKLVEDAFLATEDVRFYQHNGMDLRRLAGAVLANITDGFGSQGASTITQQVVKNSFLNNEKTLSRKAQEAWLSFQLERKYTKQEIFEMYVNKIWMSEGSHGVLTASHIYFGKDLDELELHEAALLAGMPQSPENYNPFKHPDKAEKRRNIVLSLMNQHGFITKEEMEAAQKIPVESSLVKEEDRKHNDSPYDSFVDVVIDEMEQKYPDLNVSSDGLTIHTTLDTNAQDYVEKMLNSNEIVQFPDDKFQAGITLLDTKTGEIRAIGGGRNLEVKRGFNYATDLRRQAGSTFKPILDYGPAIEYLNWGTYHVLNDEPYTYSDGTKINNWDHKHMGPMSMREALARSRNIPALKTLQEVGPDKAKEFANNLGFELDEVNESYAIGANLVSPLQMAGAYSAFGNNGLYNEPHAIKEIEMRDGTKIDVTPETKPVMKDSTAFMITDMLKSGVKDSYGTGKAANVPNLHVVGKTGTTNYSADQIQKWNIPNGALPDAWFAGYTTNYTAAVWTGYKDMENSIAAGHDQRIAQLLFKNLMEHVSQGIDTPDFPVPNSVEKVAIEKGTSKLASEFTPKDQIVYEYAVKGHAPTEISDKYDKLDSPSDLSAAYDKEANEIVLNWKYPDEVDDVQFEVSVSLDEGADQPLQVVSEKGIRVANPVPGGIYQFKVVAIRDDQRSDSAVVKVEIPAPEISDDQDDTGEGGIDNGQGNENGNPEDDGSGQGNGNGNGSDNGQGNGTDQGGGGGLGESGNPSDPGQTNPPSGPTSPGSGFQ